MTNCEPGDPQNVNIELGDNASKMFYEASERTYQNRPELLQDINKSFSGFRAINLASLGNTDDLYINMGFDGVGTKVEISERQHDHSTVAYDLFAMVCDDAVVRGGEPIAIGSILDIRSLDNSEQSTIALKQLTEGYVGAAKAAGVVVVNGEIAELGDRVNGYGEFNYNWGAAVLWVAHKQRLLDGHTIEPGQSLVGLSESGFRSNGLTDVRNILSQEYGAEWHSAVISELGKLSLGQIVQHPSTIYSRFINSLNGGYDIKREPTAQITGVAHITGGGIPSKLGRMLEPSGLGAHIDNPLPPSSIMRKVQELGNLADLDIYKKWNMGHGMIISSNEPDKVLAQANSQNIVAQKIGHVTELPKIKIKNCGIQQQEQYLEF